MAEMVAAGQLVVLAFIFGLLTGWYLCWRFLRWVGH